MNSKIFYLNNKVSWKLFGLFFIFLIFSGNVFTQDFIINDRHYRVFNDKWHTFFNGNKGDQIVLDRFVVRLKNHEDVRKFNFSGEGFNNIEVVSRKLAGDYYVVKINNSHDAFKVFRSLSMHPAFDYVEFDAIGEFHSTPNDPYYTNQWNLPKVSMNLAWDNTTGSNSIILAIIDTGFDQNHEDLDGNIWINPIEANGDANGDGYPGIQNVDDDGDGLIDEDSQGRQPGEQGYTNDLVNDDDENGYIDDFTGWDFYSDPGDNDPSPVYDPHTVYPHGTSVAGIAAAQTNNYEGGNYIGVAGIAGGWGSTPGVKIMNLRYHYWDSGPYYSSTANAITYAAENGAKIINISSGWATNWSSLEDAIDDAIDNHDCLIVASAGNYQQGQSTSVKYPAAYSNVIAVGATTPSDTRKELNDGTEYWWGSCYGSQLYVMAPGVYIYTTDITGSTGYSSGNYYDSFNGTSSAAPYVAGLAALIRSTNPTLTWQQVRETIRQSSDKVAGMNGQGFTNEYGYGRINANRAVHNLYVPQVYSTIQSALNAATSGQTVIVGSGNQNLSSNLTVPSGVTLEVNRGASITMNSYSIIKYGTGSIIIESGVLNNPDIRRQSGSTIMGLYPTISSAFTASSSGQYVHIRGTHTFTNHFTVPSGKV